LELALDRPYVTLSCRMARLEVKITTEAHEIEAAQRLRFEVFNLEMKKGLETSYDRGLDIDRFDACCEHLIVRELGSQEIVGTYRLMLGSRARQNFGFYSEQEFDLRRIKTLDGELLELGRTCARKDFRDRALIPLMWETIVSYAQQHNVRYIFGCGSLYTTSAPEVSRIFALLQKKYYAPEAFRVQPLPATAFAGLNAVSEAEGDATLFQRLPSLIKGYLRAGAWICGPPALDSEFGTTDFFVLLDFCKLGGDYLTRIGLAGFKMSDALD
jgi:L-ornithine Nalpha-acyltransferase